MNRISLLPLIPIALAMTGCAQKQEAPLPNPIRGNSQLENEVIKPTIYIDNENIGLYLNYGKFIPPESIYTIDGINGCDAVLLYAENNDIGYAAVTHFDPLPETRMSHVEKWREFSELHPELKSAQKKYFTIFYSKPYNSEDELQISIGLNLLVLDLMGIYGEDILVRSMPYEMTPAGTNPQGSDPNAPSLIVDMKTKKLTTDWHGTMGITF